CPQAHVERLRQALGVSGLLAQVLVRRGLAEPERAARFLDGEAEHDLDAFGGIDAVAEALHAHVRAGSPITVHGDYDVDGVCATALLLRALRALGADADSYIPDRAEGYGLSLKTVERLAARGTRLLVTVDCGIAARREVAAARAAGMEVIVTDHHAADGAAPPDAHVLHPVLSGYPCAELCGTAVAYKLALALMRRAGADRGVVEEDLDLVALATVADSVPLRGENRALVRGGLRALARTAKPGLRALMSCAGADPARIDERTVAFGLAPRLNAAGRLYRADAALELLLCTDPARAGQIAGELDRANHERRDTETRVLFEAEAQVAARPGQHAYVLAGERWHPGVIGIVASRLAERHGRPFVLIALDGDRGKGSGRSIEGFDLLASLDACAEHLHRHGGHRAAAGLEVERAALQEFGAAFHAHARLTLSAEDLAPSVRVDALAEGSELSLERAEELSLLAPFGRANPQVSLLLRSVSLAGVRAMGGGRHLRFAVRCGGSSMNAVAFGFGARAGFRTALGAAERFDGVFRLEVNEYNRITEARLNLVHLQAAGALTQDDAASPDAIGIARQLPYPVMDARRDHTLAG
ncbi:MAG: single-stranded-DNA-specific exonuclease RecJ, partial [Acidobacteriota bacterium]|nr:single-stranded-DNA-specific exonuclease RecJ [Acidobacteriota bacterium]